MTCDKARELFSGLLERSLSRGLTETAERHLRECPDCEYEFQTFEAMYGAAGDLPPVEVPPDLDEKIARALDKAEWEMKQGGAAGSGYGVRRTARFAAFASAAAALLVIAYFSLPDDTSGVAGGFTTRPSNSESLRVTIAEGKPRLQLVPRAGATITISEGGADFSALPPPDTTPYRTDSVAALQEYNVPLESPGSTLWITVSGESAPLVVLTPGVASAEFRGGSLIDALRFVSDRYGLVIEGRVKSAPDVGFVLLDGLSAEEALAVVLDGAGYEWRIEGNLVRFSFR